MTNWKSGSSISRLWLFATALAVFGNGEAAFSADDTAPPGRTIAYAINDQRWSVYETKDAKEECPDGLAELGPREQYAAQFPDDGTKRKYIDTQLAREGEIWFPTTAPDPFPYREAGGKIAIGLDLDGKTKPTDFTSPEGKPGIDNQLFRVVGCLGNYRDGGSVLNSDRIFFKKNLSNRLLVELTDVDSLVNDDDVTVTTYRGRDPLMMDAAGGFQPGATQRIDTRWSKAFVHRTKGKIVNAVLTTEPTDIKVPFEAFNGDGGYYWMRDGRFELKLTPDKAEGLIGGYTDLELFYYLRMRSRGTHLLSYGKQAPASEYKVLRKLADGFPDPATGENTAISAAFSVNLVRVNVLHQEKEISALPGGRQLAASGQTNVSLNK